MTSGFIAHMDVVDEVPFENIRPRVIEHYDGDDIVLNDALDIVMSPSAYPSLKNKVGKTLVVTDGTTLLGADDKAGIAEILTMAERTLPIRRTAAGSGKWNMKPLMPRLSA